jgi:hypothetical protein
VSGDPKPLCPFCGKAWTEGMVKVLDVYASQGCVTCGYGSTVSGKVDITCEGCKRTIYRKEFESE